MGRRVMRPNRSSAMTIDRDFTFVAGRDGAVADVADVKDVVADSLRVLDHQNADVIVSGTRSTSHVDLADVAHLSTLFAVEAGSIEDHRDALAVLAPVAEMSAVPDGLDQPGGGATVVFRMVVGRLHLQEVEFSKDVRWNREHRIIDVPASAASRSSFLHEDLVTVRVDGHVPFFGHDLGEIDGESVGVMELEGVDRRDPAIARSSCGLGEQLEAAIEGAAEHLLLLSDDLLNPRHLLPHLREGVAEDLDHCGNNACKEGSFHAERLAAVTDGATEDSSENVSTTVRARRGTVGDRGHQTTRVIGDDAIRDVDGILEVSAIGAGAADVGDPVKDSCEQIGVVVAATILENRHQAFESHAGIDVPGG